MVKRGEEREGSVVDGTKKERNRVRKSQKVGRVCESSLDRNLMLYSHSGEPLKRRDSMANKSHA